MPFVMRPLTCLSNVEKWKAWIPYSDNPRDLAKPLLSKLPFIDKVRIQLELRPKASENTDEMKWLETKLENAGHLQLAQIVRWQIFWSLDDSRRRSQEGRWCQEIVKADIKGRWIVQREIYVRDEAQALKKMLELSSDVDTAKASQLSAYEEELTSLNDQYWVHERSLWILTGGGPVGALKRGYKATRSDPNWYLCAWLRQECAGRGGCCGRACGCCEKSRDTWRDLKRGHCTTACGCCMRSRKKTGVKGGEKKPEMDKFPFDLAENKEAYSRRIERAYIWGLSFLDELDWL
ncbi:hypothetical protein ASPWEDRAFT_30496 [Aspergillus wentii DTO 134E9]|uniref:Uncharacterized protein n=1 Tax=Aspergillus wentii DTO 134E9 TaxID=1073089 RepID=A0A1L9RER1_ASPWE|nr:uncharacterized protein ASPWEDRAFT_30496 [Aspergillus wentii DTO 134E9]KAI9933666.1 hypothetical protein MW887_008139 [Aspergillus wentii]OJJ33419.1 hypothetical protein ASPWEDRAFT_30496 [Aspergillus wentii DTO 134E9]